MLRAIVAPEKTNSLCYEIGTAMKSDPKLPCSVQRSIRRPCLRRRRPKRTAKKAGHPPTGWELRRWEGQRFHPCGMRWGGAALQRCVAHTSLCHPERRSRKPALSNRGRTRGRRTGTPCSRPSPLSMPGILTTSTDDETASPPLMNPSLTGYWISQTGGALLVVQRIARGWAEY
jgi:hypothetical protein